MQVMTQVLVAPDRWWNTRANSLIQCGVNHWPERQLHLKETKCSYPEKLHVSSLILKQDSKAMKVSLGMRLRVDLL